MAKPLVGRGGGVLGRLRSISKDNRWAAAASKTMATSVYTRATQAAWLRWLRTVLEELWITAKQAAALMDAFAGGPAALGGEQVAAAAPRVEAAAMLHTRVVDLSEFQDAVRPRMTAAEWVALGRRLGWLNVLNPLRPEGRYDLALTMPEEHAVATYLVHLSVVEPGENWEDEMYNGMKFSLPKFWYEEAVPKRGQLALTYVTPAGGDIPAVRAKWCREHFLLGSCPAFLAELGEASSEANPANRRRASVRAIHAMYGPPAAAVPR